MDDRAVKAGKILNDTSAPLKLRFRALFTLRGIGTEEAIDQIAVSFTDTSALLKHELAFCLGQMGNEYSIKYLQAVLENEIEEPIVRHEAAEALGAIGSNNVLSLLEKYINDPSIEVSETCQIAVNRLKWLNSNKINVNEDQSIYDTVDPAPASEIKETVELESLLLDESKSLFDRYRAMFSLRNNGDKESVLALTKGLKCRSALFRHEIAYVLGQLQSIHSVLALKENLMNTDEHSMVRHESAEALGGIGTEECNLILSHYLNDFSRVVKESCVVALDMAEYENSDNFQYANILQCS